MKDDQPKILTSVEVLPAKRQPSVKVQPVVKAAFLTALVASGTLIIFVSPLRDQCARIAEICTACLMNLGWVAPVIFCAISAALVAVGVPRMFFYPVAGMAFGFWRGLLVAQIGTMLGAYSTFIFVRWSGREFIVRTWPRLSSSAEFFGRHGLKSVLLIRQLPATGFYINVLLGLTSLSHSNFFLGTFIGFLPVAVPATIVGSGVPLLAGGKSTVYTFILLAAVSVVLVYFCRFTRAFLKNKKTHYTFRAFSSPAQPHHR
jgi:uncharacterized membrane protein YdjX (TVP38/TMEM64 family)